MARVSVVMFGGIFLVVSGALNAMASDRAVARLHTLFLYRWSWLWAGERMTGDRGGAHNTRI